MLSLPDFRQKQVVYIECVKNKKIRFLNQNLIVEEKKKNPKTNREKYQIITQVPCGKIFAVFILGNFTFSSVLVDRFQKHGISLFFLNFNYRCYGTFAAKTEGNVLLRQKQYTLSVVENFEIAQHIIINKTENQISLLQKIRKKADTEKNTIILLKKLQGQMTTCQNKESLLGLEGNAAKAFFSVYFAHMKWHGRKPRTKYDIPNTLLDRGYTTLFNVVESLLRIYGFDIYCGIYHQFFYQRKSLVCDMVEPFRCIIDEALRKAYNLGQIDENDFEIYGNKYTLPYKNGGKYSRIFLEAIMEHKEDIFVYIQRYYRTFLRNKSDSKAQDKAQNKISYIHTAFPTFTL